MSLESANETVWIWGVPFVRWTMAEVVERVGQLVRDGQPSYFITANTQYVMLTDDNPRLRDINSRAAFIVADGAPLVWASRRREKPLPERVAGSDLIFELCAQAARNGHRLFLLGGPPGVAIEASKQLQVRYPELQVVGTECPPFRKLTDTEHNELIARIKATRPDLLFVAFGQPKGEIWIDENCQQLGVPVSVQIGASLEFAAGSIRRAPLWMQRSGLEWAFRLALEPRRLFARYSRNAWFIGRMVIRDLMGGSRAS